MEECVPSRFLPLYTSKSNVLYTCKHKSLTHDYLISRLQPSSTSQTVRTMTEVLWQANTFWSWQSKQTINHAIKHFITSWVSFLFVVENIAYVGLHVLIWGSSYDNMIIIIEGYDDPRWRESYMDSEIIICFLVLNIIQCSGGKGLPTGVKHVTIGEQKCEDNAKTCNFDLM